MHNELTTNNKQQTYKGEFYVLGTKS
jgi:hypothetical protein